MNKKVIVIGGGIIGLCSAYYLQKEGHEVVVIDQSNMDGGASYVNAGYLSPSHIIPLAAPGMMKKGLKWMFDPTSPLYVKPRLETDFLKWAWAFNKSCNQKKVAQAIPTIRDISLLSQELYDDIKQNESFSFHYDKKGLFMLCQTEKALVSEVKTAQLAQNIGLDAREINLTELKELEPDVTLNVQGAIYYQCDSHITPGEFIEELKTYLSNAGVQFYKNERVKDLLIKDQKILAVVTENQTFKADEFVLAAGSWSSILSKKLNLKLLLQAGKGYRINTKNPTKIRFPAILTEKKVAVTPMNGFTRFAGTMEIAGINHEINKIRVDAIANAVTNYYPEIIPTKEEIETAAAGLRPVSPDGLPYIGKSKKCDNLTIAAGHAMMGLSMSTATGKLVSEIISEQKLSMDIANFHPDRNF
tara:strand:- start:133498 stop:134745 length:1248 start_codon:yes stop_codon:yes gene_type:complete